MVIGFAALARFVNRAYFFVLFSDLFRYDNAAAKIRNWHHRRDRPGWDDPAGADAMALEDRAMAPDQGCTVVILCRQFVSLPLARVGGREGWGRAACQVRAGE
jgi:hypothetical protein